MALTLCVMKFQSSLAALRHWLSTIAKSTK